MSQDNRLLVEYFDEHQVTFHEQQLIVVQD